MSNPVSRDDIIRKLKLEYQYPQEDQTARTLDAIRSLFTVWGKDRQVLGVLQEAANLISKHLRIREIGMGLRGPDGLYRLEVFVGYRPETEAANRKLVYRLEDFGDSDVYRGVWISKLTKAYFAEDDPYAKSEEDTFNRPMLLKARRMAEDDTIEGDYFCTNVNGPEGDLLGWIEISGTTAWKLPNAQMVKWIELVACVLGGFLSSSALAAKK